MAGAGSSALESPALSNPTAADRQIGRIEAVFRLELITTVAANAPVVKVASALVATTDTPLVKSEHNEERVEDCHSLDGKTIARPILFNSAYSTATELSRPL